MHNIYVRFSAPLALITLLLFGCQKEVVVAFPSAKLRVVTIAPSTAANLSALGCGDSVVGVSEWCAVDEFSPLPRIGDLGSPSLERIAEIRPNVVLVQGRQDVLKKYCDQNSIFFKSFNTDSVSGWRNEVLWLGMHFNQKQRAAALVEQFDKDLADIPSSGLKPKCLMVLSRKNHQIADLLVAAQHSFLSELLVAAGGTNVITDKSDYVYLQEELLPQLNPQFIFELHFVDGEKSAVEDWLNNFSSLEAVRGRQVHNVFSPQALMPGPKMIETVRLLSEIIRQQKPVQ
jgi:iron complex transport system substrate-binding protein